MKESFYYTLLVLVVLQLKTASSGHSRINQIDHLPSNLVPLKHDLKFYPDFDDEVYLFHGDVRITIRCDVETSSIVLYMKELMIVEKKVTVNLQSGLPTDSIRVEDHAYDPDRDLYTILLKDKLKEKLIYEVFIPFKKGKSTYVGDFGYIEHEYTKDPAKPKKVIGVTISDLNDARRIFPGFDMMSIKTEFNLQLGLPLAEQPNIKGISSLKFIKNMPDTEEKGRALCIFKESHLISTYSFAFLVANLESMTRKHLETEVLIKVWADVAVIGKMESTLTMLVKVFNFYYEYFGAKPPIDVLNLIVIPSVPEMKTEKSGFILLEESNVLLGSNLHSDDEADVLLRLCYEVNRQWMGVGATLLEWNEYWLDLGMATFIREFCFKELFSGKTNNPLDLELVETFTDVLRIDGQSVSSPIYVDEKNFELNTMFTELILHDKAYLIIRMMGHFLGQTNFQNGIKAYFNQNNLKNSSLDQVWNVFNKIAEEAKLLPQFTTVKSFMEFWTRRKGYSLVTVERDFTLKTVKLKQSRFVQLEDQDRIAEHYGHTDYPVIPLSYATKTQLEESRGKELPAKIEWLKYSSTISSVPDEMIIVNPGMKALCRVLYDETTRQLISQTLNSKTEFNIIDDKTRASLIGDMFALTAVGKEPYTYEKLFRTMLYLENEDSDLPVMMALQEFKAIRSILVGLKEDPEEGRRDGTLKNFETYVQQILTPIFKRKRFVRIDEMPNVKQEFLIKNLVIELACMFGVEECTSQCTNLFTKWRESDSADRQDLIPVSILETVFCQAIKHGGINEFHFLWNEFNKNNDESLNELILSALGCFNQDEFLQTYLYYSIFLDKEMPKYSHAIISGLVMNANGYAVAKKFFTTKINDILKNPAKVYNGIISSFLIKLFEHTTNLIDFTRLTRIKDATTRLNVGYESLLEKSVEIANRNSLWAKKHENTLKSVLRTYMLFDTDSVFEMKMVPVRPQT